MKKILVLVVLAVCLSGCKKKITEGEVYRKEYQPETTTMMPIPNTIWVGETPITTYTYIPVTNDEDWTISIKNEEERTRKIYVSEDFYRETKIGDKIVITKKDVSIVRNKDGL